MSWVEAVQRTELSPVFNDTEAKVLVDGMVTLAPPMPRGPVMPCECALTDRSRKLKWRIN